MENLLLASSKKIVFDLSRQGTEYGVRSTEEEKLSIEHLSLSLEFLGANREPEITANDLQQGKVNYLIGNDPGKWQSNIPTYKEVLYNDLYPGIDLRVYGNQRELEYDLIVSPGADPKEIIAKYDGVEGLRISEEGELLIKTAFGELKQKRPVIYQEIDGRRVKVEGKFRIQNAECGSQKSEEGKSAFRIPHSAFYTYGFEVAAYNPNYPLIIDPTLAYSTYLGGGGNDYGLAIAVDSTGAAYITGYTDSTDFPTTSSYQTDTGGLDAFVTKLAPAGNSLSYSTYLGGVDNDYGYGIAVDSTGAAYITGYTDSTDFPTTSSYQTDTGGVDAFVTKLA
ncbi:MAG: SBBP repeat-containing protein, partial [bacterium]|nr:SBBP repeat-containing protein [bacterium]